MGQCSHMGPAVRGLGVAPVPPCAPCCTELCARAPEVQGVRSTLISPTTTMIASYPDTRTDLFLPTTNPHINIPNSPSCAVVRPRVSRQCQAALRQAVIAGHSARPKQRAPGQCYTVLLAMRSHIELVVHQQARGQRTGCTHAIFPIGQNDNRPPTSMRV